MAYRILTALGAAFLTLTMVALTRPVAAEELKLRVADSFPTTHYVVREMTKPWMEKVTELTGGKVKFEYYPAQQLGNAKDLLSLTQSGVADIGYVAPSYVGDKLPLSAVAELPEAFSASCQGTKALWAIAKPGGLLDEKELKPLGVEALFVLVLAPYQIFTAATPITGIDSFSGQKIRASGGAKEITATKLGAIPVQISAPETREALSRRTIDSILFPNSSIAPYSLGDLISYATTGMNFGSYVVTYLIRRDRWEQLPADVRSAMEEAAVYAMNKGCNAVDALDKDDAANLEKKGVKYVKFDAAQMTKINELLSNVGTEWATKLDERNLAGTEILKSFRSELKKAAP